jgi:hypothetical protein
VKASGLAAGKGVVICDTASDAIATARSMFDGQFGDAGTEVVIEEFLEGEEASFIVMADGRNILTMATSQDHKRLRDADAGPNTGGMGAYSPAPVVTRALHERIMREVIEPTIRGLARDGTPYTGFLYAGIMVHPDGTPNVLEYNCRFGDPETQPIMMRLQSDLVAGRAELAAEHGLRRGDGIFGRVDDDHALAGRQARGLDDDGRALRAHPGGIEGGARERRVRGGRDAVALQEFLGIGLRAFELRRGLQRAEATQARGLECVYDADDQRRLGADDGEANSLLLRQRDETGHVFGGHVDITHARLGGRAAIAGCNQHFGNLR